MSARPRLVIFKTGRAFDALRETFGDYDRLFLAAVDGLGLDAKVVNAEGGERLPAVDEADLVIVTGSPCSVTTPDPWVDDLADWTNRALERGTPYLGVCYGHQLITYAQGGGVAENPLGYELGTVDVRLTEAGRADPLLGSLALDDQPLAFQSVHGDAVVKLPASAVLLADSEGTAVQAFALGDRTWGVQFHPEFDDRIIALYVKEREPLLRARAAARGKDPDVEAQKAKRSVRPSPAGRALLHRFVTHARELLARS